ncbi:MAG: MOSC domain-containing protein [Solirubrobacterales bacterium]|nr:MOSC domain-containing protein [Solirubrobacterales bacterium]
MRLAEIWRYPVKSLRGERVQRARLERGGLDGDRSIHIHRDGKVVTALTLPRLEGLAGTLGEDGEPRIDGQRWDSAEAHDKVRAIAGEEIELVRIDGVRYDEAPLLVTSDGAVGALGEDGRRFRPNLVVEGVEGLSERDWVGLRLRVGEVELIVRESCVRCMVTTIHPDSLEIEPSILRRINEEFNGLMGVYCEVALSGEIAQGDSVELAE